MIFKGRVQGVWFRANTQGKARELGIHGWVRNLQDGSVEAVFEGTKEDIEEAIQWCKTSQPHARVTSVDIIWEDYQDRFQGFEIRY